MSYQTRIIASMPFNREPLFSALCMLRQGAVGEAKSLHGVVFIHDIGDATGVQRIEPEVVYGNCYVGADLYRLGP
ncbi:MAG: hypothetical protein ABSF15_09615 [Candidatus Sulfotelmatobacter sp.]|jgi:hypothetical protein